MGCIVLELTSSFDLTTPYRIVLVRVQWLFLEYCFQNTSIESDDRKLSRHVEWLALQSNAIKSILVDSIRRLLYVCAWCLGFR